ncbi:hypothetical protein [Photobacterium sp. 1_MG-2023]|uniref:DUF7282 domain-containing protein n=1 Tax=Photobacterium sp. 1_MG-2023 TaxID=3062646 RepID=UPI0026E2C53A|nr:hypothetical protein [Photobacterium sp. 1_MG-2023]MDO6707295.1 hypothetical protein [Photobacterium sp. 1_MG-2023]
MNLLKTSLAASFIITAFGAASFAHAANSVKGSDQDVSGGTVSAEMIESDANGWLVVHRTDKSMKPGPVVGYSPVKKGTNQNVTAILMEPVNSGDMLMLMLHGEGGGMKTGVFEYTLGAKEDGPIREDGKLIMDVITVQ